MLNKITLQGMAGASTHPSFLRDSHALPLPSFFGCYTKLRVCITKSCYTVVNMLYKIAEVITT